MNDTARHCADCGALHPKCVSVSSMHGELYFCNLQCKSHYFNVTLPDLILKEKKNEEESSSILPQVRTLIAHKNKNGSITVMRGDGKF